jgi:hypothetical protein
MYMSLCNEEVCNTDGNKFKYNLMKMNLNGENEPLKKNSKSHFEGGKNSPKTQHATVPQTTLEIKFTGQISFNLYKFR